MSEKLNKDMIDQLVTGVEEENKVSFLNTERDKIDKEMLIYLIYDKSLPNVTTIREKLDQNVTLQQIYDYYEIPERLVFEDGDNPPCEFIAHLGIWEVLSNMEGKPTIIKINTALKELGIEIPKSYPVRVMKGRENDYKHPTKPPIAIWKHISYIHSIMGTEDTIKYKDAWLGGANTRLSKEDNWEIIVNAIARQKGEKTSKFLDLPIEENVSTEAKTEDTLRNITLDQTNVKSETNTKLTVSEAKKLGKYPKLVEQNRELREEVKGLNTEVKHLSDSKAELEKELEKVNKELSSSNLVNISLQERYKELQELHSDLLNSIDNKPNYELSNEFFIGIAKDILKNVDTSENFSRDVKISNLLLSISEELNND